MSIYRITKPLLTVLFVCSLLTELLAQKRTTVFLNIGKDFYSSQKDSILLEFNPFLLPKNYKFGDTTIFLQMWLSKNTLGSGQETQLTIKSVTANEQYLGKKKLEQATKSLSIKLNQEKLSPYLSSPFSIKGVFPKPDTLNTSSYYDNIQFYSSDINSESYDLARQPKLVLDYEVTKEPYRSDWSQLGSNAQRTNGTDWLVNSTPFFSYQTQKIPLGNFSSDYISLFDNQLILFKKDAVGKSYMTQLNGITNAEQWKISTNGNPIKQPVIDGQGRMYYFNEQNTMDVFDLNKRELLTSKPLKDITINVSQNNSIAIHSLTNEITLGFDGTLILPISNTAGNIGIVALTAYPDLRARWFYNTVNPVGPISLSENEKLAFFIETSVKENKSKLVVLDNTNGMILATTDLLLRPFTNDNNSYIPPVVLQKVDNKKTNVYVLNGYKTANELFIFHINDSIHIRTDDILKLKPLHVIKSEQKENVGISRPVVTKNGTVFLILNGTLQKFDVDNKRCLKFFQVQRSSRSIEGIYSDDATLIANASDYIYIFSKKSTDFYYADHNYSSFINFRLNNLNENRGLLKPPFSYKNVVLAPNLAVYCIPESGQEVVKFFPGSIYSSEINSIENKTVYISQEAKMKENIIVSNSTNATIIGSSVVFKRGFTVKKGAAVNFQVQKKYFRQY